MKVLEQDWFDQSPRTPTNTSWSMTLLDRLDAALGSKLLDRPTFPLDDPNASPPQLPLSELAEAIRRGDYDNLFDDTDHRPSAMFADAQKVVPQPSVTLLSLTPFKPTELVLPNYPAIAKAARVGGKLTVDLDVNAQGQIANVAMTGPKLLQSATEKAVTSWKFGTEAGSSHVQAVFRFDLNCEVKASVH